MDREGVLLLRPAGRDRWASEPLRDGVPDIEIVRLPGGRAWVKHRASPRPRVFDSVAEAKAYVRTAYGAWVG